MWQELVRQPKPRYASIGFRELVKIHEERVASQSSR